MTRRSGELAVRQTYSSVAERRCVAKSGGGVVVERWWEGWWCRLIWYGSGRRLLVVRAGAMSQLPNDACRGLGARKPR